MGRLTLVMFTACLWQEFRIPISNNGINFSQKTAVPADDVIKPVTKHVSNKGNLVSGTIIPMVTNLRNAELKKTYIPGALQRKTERLVVVESPALPCPVITCACPGYSGWTGQLYAKQQGRVGRKLDPQDCLCKDCLGSYYIWEK